MDGLIALAAGVVGALIAIVGTLGLELRREDIARDGAARALFFELAQNTGWLIKGLSSRPTFHSMSLHGALAESQSRPLFRQRILRRSRTATRTF